MAVLRFRVYWEDDDSIYRDIVIKHVQRFSQLHECILKSYEFDSQHKASFFRSNDHWQRGRAISLEKYDEVEYKVDPLIMADTAIGSEIKDPNQKFIYVYDFNKMWTFMVELINVDREENKKLTYPCCIRTEGIGPAQYGTKGLINKRLAEVEEKYDLNAESMLDGFSEEDEDGNATGSADEYATEDGTEEL